MNKPLFWVLTGKDFSDAIRMANTEKNLVREAIQKKIKELKNERLSKA